jgi:hypothetical protein
LHEISVAIAARNGPFETCVSDIVFTVLIPSLHACLPRHLSAPLAFLPRTPLADLSQLGTSESVKCF